MGDMGDMFRDMRAEDQKRRERNLANADPTGWTQHTPYHWSRKLNGKTLDYWPSRNKFAYEGKVLTGNVAHFIRRRSA